MSKVLRFFKKFFKDLHNKLTIDNNGFLFVILYRNGGSVDECEQFLKKHKVSKVILDKVLYVAIVRNEPNMIKLLFNYDAQVINHRQYAII